MKKYLAIVAVLFATNVNAADLTRDDVVGKWLCSTQYTDINTTTLDAYEFFADGKSKSSGLIKTFLDNQTVLSFTIQAQGKWSFDKNVLTETYITRLAQPRHNTETRAALAKDRELAQLADSLQKTFNDNSGDEESRTIKLQWTRDSKNPNRIHVKQIDGTNGEGFCLRVSEKIEE